MREQNEQGEKKNKRKKSSIKLIVFFLAMLIIAWFVGYYIFEVYRLEQYNIRFLEDWRSYTAFLTSKIPYIKRYVKYEPLKILTVESFYKEQFSVYLERLNEQSKKLEKRAEELSKLKKNIEDEQKKLEQLKKEVEGEKRKLEREKAEWTDYKNRLKTLANWLASSDPSKIAPAISNEEVSVDLLVDALRMLSDDTAAEILQALSSVDPKKAASIFSRLGSKEDEK